MAAIVSLARHSLVSVSFECLDVYTATALIECFAEKPFPLVRHLVLDQRHRHQPYGVVDQPYGVDLWPQIMAAFPALVTLEIANPMRQTVDFVAAVGASVVATLQNLIFTSIKMEEITIAELLRVIKLPNLAGVHRLEIPMTSKDDFVGEAGLALLDECEKRSISLLCRYGYL
ncbi:hypothetical protein RQP46_010539 [Phenoliferia psychrophenolica]